MLFEISNRIWFQVAACHSTEMRKQIELCLKTDHSVMEAELYQELKNIRMEPVFCMTFMSVPLFTKFQEFFPSFGAIEHKGKKMKFSESITKLKHVHRGKIINFCPIEIVVLMYYRNHNGNIK
ncbi:UNVERIFIED_CONTAM: hypothetical protein NCL1_45787 [Trichonephila clavipes]